jgi:hypothetical protein
MGSLWRLCAIAVRASFPSSSLLWRRRWFPCRGGAGGGADTERRRGERGGRDRGMGRGHVQECAVLYHCALAWSVLSPRARFLLQRPQQPQYPSAACRAASGPIGLLRRSHVRPAASPHRRPSARAAAGRCACPARRRGEGQPWGSGTEGTSSCSCYCCSRPVGACYRRVAMCAVARYGRCRLPT